MSEVGKEVLLSSDVVREEGGARGDGVSVEEGACADVGVLCVDILKSSDVVAVPDGVGASKWIGPSGLNLLTQQVDSKGEGFCGLSLNQEVLGRAADDPTHFVKVSKDGDPLVVDGSNLKKGKEVFLPAHIEVSEDSISNNTLENNSEAHSSDCSDESHNSLHEVALGLLQIMLISKNRCLVSNSHKDVALNF
jgi:hypothetical protein